MKETYEMGKWLKPKNYRERKHNIVYRTTVRTGGKEYFYVGKHSTDVLEDGYLGSGPKFRKFLREHPDSETSREILSDWETVEEALLEEERVVTLGMLRNPFCLNSIRGGGTFDTTGRVPSLDERKSQAEKMRGHVVSEEQRKKISEKLKGRRGATRGRVWVSLGEEKHLVNPENLQKWLDAGYRTGMPDSTKQGSQNFHKNSVWIHRGAENKIIRKSELESYLEQGFEEGRVLEKGKRVWMKRGLESQMVLQENVEQMKCEGWIPGRVL